MHVHLGASALQVLQVNGLAEDAAALLLCARRGQGLGACVMSASLSARNVPLGVVAWSGGGAGACRCSRRDRLGGGDGDGVDAGVGVWRWCEGQLLQRDGCGRV